jgi:hypothetical protein
VRWRGLAAIVVSESIDLVRRLDSLPIDIMAINRELHETKIHGQGIIVS